MARVWKHIDPDTGDWTDWPVDELPSWQSVYRVGFLNQFVGWANYLNAILNVFATEDPIPEIEFVANGTDIQKMEFWNGLYYKPLGLSGIETQPSIPAFGWLNAGSRSDYLTSGVDVNVGYNATITVAEYSENDPDLYLFEAGDIIQPRRTDDCAIRKKLLSMRWCIDNSVAYINNEYIRDTFSFESRKIQYWNSVSGYSEVITEPGANETPNPYILRIDGVQDTYSIWSYLNMSVTTDVGFDVQLVASSLYSTGAGSTPAGNIPFDYPTGGRFAILTNPTTGPATLISGYYVDVTTPEYSSTGDDGAHSLVHPMIVPDDELPDAFKPEGGFPWD